jgi:RimJ/RimL family protein N-acetyltransferase
MVELMPARDLDRHRGAAAGLQRPAGRVRVGASGSARQGRHGKARGAMGQIPELRTDRLILRGMARADFTAFAAVWQEPEVMRFLGRKPRPRSESWAAFLRNAGGWALGQGYGREATEAAHAWFDAQPFGGRSHAMIEVGHQASFRVADRLGYRFMREAEDMGDRVMLLVRDRHEIRREIRRETRREGFGGTGERR